MAYFLPFRSSLRALGFSDPKTTQPCLHDRSAPLAHLDAASASATQTGRLTTEHPVRLRPPAQGTSPELHWPFSICGHGNPFFRSPNEGRPKSIAKLSGSAAPRVWLPSLRFESPTPLEVFSTSNAHGLRPSELSSFFAIGAGFHRPPSAPALSYKTLPDLVPALQRLTPTKKAVPTSLLPR